MNWTYKSKKAIFTEKKVGKVEQYIGGAPLKNKGKKMLYII